MLHPWLSSEAWNTLTAENCTERPDLTVWIGKLIDNNKLTCGILNKSAPSFVDIKDSSRNRKLQLRDTFKRIVHLKGNNRRSLSRLVKAVKKINECLPKTVDSSLDIILNDLTEEINKQKTNIQLLDNKSKVLKQKIDDLSLPSPVSCDFEERKRNLHKLKKQFKDDRKDLKRHILTWNTIFFAETGRKKYEQIEKESAEKQITQQLTVILDKHLQKRQLFEQLTKISQKSAAVDHGNAPYFEDFIQLPFYYRRAVIQLDLDQKLSKMQGEPPPLPESDISLVTIYLTALYVWLIDQYDRRSTVLSREKKYSIASRKGNYADNLASNLNNLDEKLCLFEQNLKDLSADNMQLEEKLKQTKRSSDEKSKVISEFRRQVVTEMIGSDRCQYIEILEHQAMELIEESRHYRERNLALQKRYNTLNSIFGDLESDVLLKKARNEENLKFFAKNVEEIQKECEALIVNRNALLERKNRKEKL